MRPNRLLLSLFATALLSAGCKKGEGTVHVSVTADPAIAQITSLEVRAGSAPAVTVTPSAPFALPPAQTLALVAPASLGSTLHLRITAKNGDAIVGEGEADAPLAGGKRSDVTVTLGPPGSIHGDGGAPDDGGRGDDGPVVVPGTLRQLAPISGSTATTKRPTLHWVPPVGVSDVKVELCATRSCGVILADVTVDGSKGVPATDLPRGVVFWRVKGTASSAPISSKTWALSIPGVGTARDTAQGPDRDIEGDGKANIIGGAPNGADPQETPTGSISIETNGTDWRLYGTSNGEHFGAAVAIVGDTDGDKKLEFVVGAPATANVAGTGITWRIDVRGAGASMQSGPPLLKSIYGPDNLPSHTDISVDAAGDLNGDGFADIAYGDTTPDGRVYVVMGGATGLDYTHPITLDGPAGEGAKFGLTVTAAGDIDGDGFGDLLVAAPNAPVNKVQATGQLYVFRGGSAGLQQPAIQVLDGPDGANALFSQAAVALGDVNGDGYADVAVGSAYPIAGKLVGRIHIYHGSADGMLHEAKVLESPSGFDHGWGGRAQFSGWTDLNGDGYHDLVAINKLDPTGAKLYVFLGGTGGITTAQPTSLANPTNAVSWGAALKAVGDTDLDGLGDVAVGEPYYVSRGRIYVYKGSADGLSPNSPTLIDFADVGSALFGSAID